MVNSLLKPNKFKHVSIDRPNHAMYDWLRSAKNACWVGYVSMYPSRFIWTVFVWSLKVQLWKPKCESNPLLENNIVWLYVYEIDVFLFSCHCMCTSKIHVPAKMIALAFVSIEKVHAVYSRIVAVARSVTISSNLNLSFLYFCVKFVQFSLSSFCIRALKIAAMIR